MSWTDIPKPSTSSYTNLGKPVPGFTYAAGMTIGLIIPLTTPFRIIGNGFINIPKPSGTSYTNIPKPT